MKKYLLGLIIFSISTLVHGQQISYESWKQEAKTEIRLLPKYGNRPKSKEQKEADEELIKTYLAQEGTNRKASDFLVNRGFEYIYRKDLRTAMYRFNQAWLLDPKNENVYWGFGAIYCTFQDFETAIKQYEEGLTLNPNSSNILTDKATVFLIKYHQNNNQNDLDIAIDILNKSYLIDKKNQSTLFKLSVCYFQKNDCENAWKYYNECKILGGKGITPEYTKALIQKCGQKTNSK